MCDVKYPWRSSDKNLQRAVPFAQRRIIMAFKGFTALSTLRAICARYHYYIHFDIDSPGHPSQPIIRLRATYANESRNRVIALRVRCFKVPRAKWTTSLSLHLRHAMSYEYKGENYIANTTKGIHIYTMHMQKTLRHVIVSLNFFF